MWLMIQIVYSFLKNVPLNRDCGPPLIRAPLSREATFLLPTVIHLYQFFPLTKGQCDQFVRALGDHMDIPFREGFKWVFFFNFHLKVCVILASYRRE